MVLWAGAGFHSDDGVPEVPANVRLIAFPSKDRALQPAFCYPARPRSGNERLPARYPARRPADRQAPQGGLAPRPSQSRSSLHATLKPRSFIYAASRAEEPEK